MSKKYGLRQEIESFEDPNSKDRMDTGDDEYWLGPFPVWEIVGDEVYISWPNLEYFMEAE